MPTSQSNLLGESLAETLSIGSITGGSDIETSNDDVIKAVNGGSYIDLRDFGVDSVFVFANQSTFTDGAFYFGTTTEIRAGFKTAKLKAEELQIQIDLPAANTFQLRPNNLAISNFALPFDIEGPLSGVANGINDVLFGIASTTAISINSGFSLLEKSEVKGNVNNSVLLGGKGLTAKTDFTAYLNQLSFQESGILFDAILKSGVITADRTQTLQDKSGVIALLTDTTIGNYTEKWSIYAATQDDTWHSIIIADAQANSIIEMTIINNSGQNDVGVREVGSILNRHIPSIANSATTLTVKTDSLKQVQFYTSDFTDTDFYFSAQL
jgi:hypothetical protein